MSNLIKMPHEISLWDDILTVVDSEGKEYSGLVDPSGIDVKAQYYKEKKLCIISQDGVENAIFAVEPSLTQKTDGTSTLIFSMHARYYDEEVGDFLENPFVQYLTNERKVKLKYYPNGELKWLDFVIKKIDESSENYKFTYTATDLFVNELSKSGYNLEFDLELENNQDTVQGLAEKILDGTDWSVGANTELLQQTVTEPLYRIQLTKDIEAIDIFDETKKIKVKAGEVIYSFYSTIVNQQYDYFQFIYNSDGNYITDENDVLYGVGNYYMTFNATDVPYEEYSYISDFRGERYVRSLQVVYDEVLQKYVNVYDNGAFYGYAEDRYITPALVSNLIVNGSRITRPTGWIQQQPKTLEVKKFDARESGQEGGFWLKFVQSEENSFIINTGFKDDVEKIQSFSRAQKLAARIKAYDENQNEPVKGATIEIVNYAFDADGKIIKSDDVFYEATLSKACGDGCYSSGGSISYNRNFSPEEMINPTNGHFGVLITMPKNGTYYIEQVELFVEEVDQNNNIILPNGKLLTKSGEVLDEEIENYIKTTYYYYSSDQQATKESEIKFFVSSDGPSKLFTPDYIPHFEKIRGISAKETNRFNLLQSLSETFECWCDFEVWHKPTGEIMLKKDVTQTFLGSEGTDDKAKYHYDGGDPNTIAEQYVNANGFQDIVDGYRQQKFVTFHKRIGQKKDVGFMYGLNLKSINRSLDSNDIATKLIVKNNNNKYANMGSCNIARASANPSGENFVLDFSHYVKSGLLNYYNVQNDLYFNSNIAGENRGWIGLYYNLKPLNKERDGLILQQSTLVSNYSKYKSDRESYRMYYEEASNRLREQQENYEALTGYTYNKNNQEPNEWEDNFEAKAIIEDIDRLQIEVVRHLEDYEKAEAELNKINKELAAIETELDLKKQEIANLIGLFEKKYSRFIQEASWISEDYTDDNLYYFDAESTLHNSAQPKVSYTINIVELSQLEEYKGYNFNLGDITYIQDPDFFGWTYIDGIKTPYKEEIVITETTSYFNTPEKNTLKAKNYRDSFEDLFQRLTASSQQLQFHSGAYDRASDAVNSEGNIVPQALSDAFAHNAYVLSNIANQSVKWDEYGITTTDTTNPADVVRVTSGGIYLTEDGGDSWTTGISASGINAKVITTGQLNTGNVTIMNGRQPAFRWDSKGLNAFKETEQIEIDEEGKEVVKNIRSSKTFVRFDEHGLYGIDGHANFDPKEDSDGKTGIDKINEEAKFALTWDGFVLNSSANDDNTARVKISDIDDFQILDKDNKERLKIGRLEGQNSVGMRIQTTHTDNEVVIGDTGFEDTSDDRHGRMIFKAGPSPVQDEDGNWIDNANFRVYEDGFVYAKNAQIGGSLTASQLRDVKIDVSYISEPDGTAVILTCVPTIPKDKINAIVWRINGTTIDESVTSLKLTYDNLKGFIKDSASIQIDAVAQISKMEEDDQVESIIGHLILPLEGIFKIVVEYINSESNSIPAEEDGWSTESPEFEAGKYRWQRTRTIYLVESEVVKYEVIYYGKNGESIQDLNLKADAYTFVQNKEGEVTQEPIKLIATAHNLFNGTIVWEGVDQKDVDNVTNTATLSYRPDDYADGKGHVVTVKYQENTTGKVLFTDSVTVLLVKDGSDAISASLTNPTMTFTKGIDSTEITSVLVYRGSTLINYATSGNTGWRYDINCAGATISNNGVISITNPNENASFVVTVTVYKDGKVYNTQTLMIKCLVMILPYVIDLSNDNATIGVDTNGACDTTALKEITQTEVKVYRDTVDITANCEFNWSVQNGALNSTTGYSNFFTALSASHDVAIATVTVKLKPAGTVIGTKTLTVSKAKTGASAVSYKLNVSPNVINQVDNELHLIKMQVLKITGGLVEDITKDKNFNIYVNNEDKGGIDERSIGVETTFDLYIDGQKWDSEFVSIVRDGKQGQAAIVLELTNDGTSIDTDSEGKLNLGSGEISFSTVAQVYEGGSLGSDWEYSISPYEGIGYRTEQSEGVFVFYFNDNFNNTDSINFTISAHKNGFTSPASKTFRVNKNKTGATGAAATIYEIVPSINIVNVDNTSVNSFSFQIHKIVGGNAPEVVTTQNSPAEVGVKYQNGENITPSFYLGTYTVNYTNDISKEGIVISMRGYRPESIPFVKNGNPGPSGYSGTMLTLYRRYASKPSLPNGNLTYTFSTKTLVGSFNNWSTSIPSGSNPCYATYAYASSNTDTDTIAATEWSDPIIIEGKNGTNGINTATVFLYKRASSKPTAPAQQLTYSFSSGNLSGTLSGWTQTIPAANGYPCYFIQNVVAGIGNEATIEQGDWSSPEIYVQDGSKGSTIRTATAYYLSSSASPPQSKPNGSYMPDNWSSTPQDINSSQKYQYVSQCTVTDGIYGTWSDPVLFARYGSDGAPGSSATVDAINVFNALTSNGEKFGCFGNDGNSLYINANYINTGILRVGDTNSEIFYANINDQLVGIGGFGVGKIRLTGALKEAIYYGLVASSDGLTNDVDFDSMLICPKGLLYSNDVAGQSGLTWKMIVGRNFGITNNGALYASDAHISGSITNTATGASGNTQTIKLKEGYMECEQKINNKTYKRIASGPYDSYTIDDNITGFTVGYNTALSNVAVVGFSNTYIKFSSSEAQLFGTWKGTSSQAISSDRSKKNTIKILEEPYEALYDNLIPVTYKYNDGLSGRTHTGFIAQEVAQALAIAGMSTKDFAGYIVANEFNSETGEEEEVCYLRYEEFISLNTWQIQKLKSRMTAAEQEIESLRTEIELLRAELKTLK